MSGTWGLRFGGFDCTPGAREDCDIKVLTFRRGKPVPVTKVVDSMLENGSIEQVIRHDNRDQSLIIGIRAGNSKVVSRVEKELDLECRKVRNELAWTPPDGFGATSVYDVTLADPELVESDDWDIKDLDGYRVWQVTFRSLSFARAAVLTTVAALASGVTPASHTIADGTSATDWTGTAAVTASGGTLRQTVSTTADPFWSGVSYLSAADFIYTPTSPLTWFATENYLYFDVTPQAGGQASWHQASAFADGVALEYLASFTTTGSTTRWYFQCTDASVAELKIHVDGTNVYATGGGSLASATHQIDNVTSTNQAPSTAATPGREALRTIAVKGSAPSPASLAMEHETLGLGKVLILSHPALEIGGFIPNLRIRRVSGGGSETSDGSRVSGKKSTVDTTVPEVFRIPTQGMPRGGYLLLALPVTDTFTDVEVTASTRLATGTLIGTKTTRNRNVQTESGFQILASLTLPPADVPEGSTAQVELSVLSMSGSTVQYDEMFLIPLGDDTGLTLVDCGAGTAAALGTANSRLWIKSASIDRPAPSIWLGTAAGQADAYFAGESAGSWMRHPFTPPSVTVFTANTGGANAAVWATYYESAHTNIVGES
ncbi:hypothetical protein [Nocardioides sp. PD653]|uniref:hypothetical protein n=1 Tax=Nocardioides sp. PD653 TaxID=393303 RepID=UPI001056BCDF|nr:hypothetical protein [Nocardioides sp. PD653]